MYVVYIWRFVCKVLVVLIECYMCSVLSGSVRYCYSNFGKVWDYEEVVIIGNLVGLSWI